MVRYFFAGTTRRLLVEFVKGDERISVDANYLVSVNDSNALLATALAGRILVQTDATLQAT